MFACWVQEKQDQLAREAMMAAQNVDATFERAKIQAPFPGAEMMRKNVEELETVLKEKEALLQKSLDKVVVWERTMKTLRDAQPSVLIPPS